MYVVGTHLKHLSEGLLMSTHNVCFCREIKKNINTFGLKKNQQNTLSTAIVVGNL